MSQPWVDRIGVGGFTGALPSLEAPPRPMLARFAAPVSSVTADDPRLDFNAWRAANPGALGNPFVAGQVFHAQGWFRDPGAPKQTNLSDGLRFTLCE